MGSGKNITFATATNSGNNTWQLVVSQKQVSGVTFSNDDVTGPLSFVFHQLEIGSPPGWTRGTGSINGSRQVTIDSIIEAVGFGTLPPSNYTTLPVSSTGIVTSSNLNESSFSGIMSPDKKVIIGTSTDPVTGNFQLRVIQFTGSTLSAGDVPCVTSMHTLIGGTVGLWQHGTIATDSSGISLFKSYLDSMGNTSAASFVISASSDGTLTRPSEPVLQFHGTVSFGKDMAVATYTAAQGAYDIVFSLW